MGKGGRGRVPLVAGALLLLATAALHGSGVSMIDGWMAGLKPEARSFLRLTWISDSTDWAVAAFGWLIAAWRRERAWGAAAALFALIPAITGLALLLTDPTFFGSYLLLAAAGLAFTGVALLRRSGGAPA